MWRVAPWFHAGDHVGFLVRERGRLVAAIDTDHQWLRPVWVDASRSQVSRIAIDALAYVLNDVFAAEEDAGHPFLCGELSWQRRSLR
jgi:hypothetical protein